MIRREDEDGIFFVVIKLVVEFVQLVVEFVFWMILVFIIYFDYVFFKLMNIKYNKI